MIDVQVFRFSTPHVALGAMRVAKLDILHVSMGFY
jgi:hypothetical protein